MVFIDRYNLLRYIFHCNATSDIAFIYVFFSRAYIPTLLVVSVDLFWLA